SLQTLHVRKIIHGDVKPGNVLISFNGHLSLCDFNSSRIFPDASEHLNHPRSGRTMPSPGTLVYCAPELLRHFAYEDAVLDVWSAGLTLLEFVLGDPEVSALH
ncbi:kinase-like domain-containing protein, partial [Vararia minispora EC-137]